jgi:N-hydroxyarylamine O-acetyltransferase
MDVQAYLNRIHYTGPVCPTPETLRLLHRSHLETVPFENLDISRSKLITMDEASFVRKVVEDHRGGFCYELNGAFAALLRGLGFRVTLISARVAGANGDISPEFDHLALRVDLSDSWLADVGFGDLFAEPLLLQPASDQAQDVGIFRISERGSGALAVERLQENGNWKPEYVFTLTPRELQDFAPMCHFHQSSPESHFTQNRICSRLTADGRITITDRKVIVTAGGVRTERNLSSEEDWAEAIRNHFGISLE